MVSPFLPDAEKLAAVRAALPAVGAGIYLNTAQAGPLPAETAAAMAEMAERELRIGRGHRADIQDAATRADEARAAVASVLRASPDSIALTHGAADGIRLAADALAGSSSRLVRVAMGLEDGVAESVRDRRDDMTVGAIDAGSDGLVAAVGRTLERSTAAVVVVPHVLLHGSIAPIERLAAIAHQHGAALVVDGSQALGAIPVSVTDLPVDAYAVPAWTWLLGPYGIGAVWLSDRALRPSDRDSGASPRTAAALEVGDWDRASVVGFARSIGWLAMYVGWSFVHDRGAMLARTLAERLTAIDGVTLLTPAGAGATIVAIRIDGWHADVALAELEARLFVIAGTIPAIDALRFSVGFFTTEEEIERLAGGVELIASHTVESLPRRRTLTILGSGT